MDNNMEEMTENYFQFTKAWMNIQRKYSVDTANVDRLFMPLFEFATKKFKEGKIDFYTFSYFVIKGKFNRNLKGKLQIVTGVDIDELDVGTSHIDEDKIDTDRFLQISDKVSTGTVSKVVNLYYSEGFNTAEIAVELNLSRQRVHVLLRRGIADIKAELGDLP